MKELILKGGLLKELFLDKLLLKKLIYIWFEYVKSKFKRMIFIWIKQSKITFNCLYENNNKILSQKGLFPEIKSNFKDISPKKLSKVSKISFKKVFTYPNVLVIVHFILISIKCPNKHQSKRTLSFHCLYYIQFLSKLAFASLITISNQ